MNIIVGLGNPGKSYNGTRHNVGFDAIDYLSQEHNIAVTRKKHRAFIGEGFVSNKKVILVKPQTYMNLSGECVQDILSFYKLTPENLIVLYDDITLDVSCVKIREKGSSGGHNGIKNIIWHLDTDEFIRVKIGIGQKPQEFISLADYVLSRFSESENIKLGIETAARASEMLLVEGSQKAMNHYNQRKLRV